MAPLVVLHSGHPPIVHKDTQRMIRATSDSILAMEVFSPPPLPWIADDGRGDVVCVIW